MSLQVSTYNHSEPLVSAPAATVSESIPAALSFDEFYGQYKSDVLRWCSRFFTLKDEVQDLAQEVWTKVYLSFDLLDQSRQQNPAWLRKLVTNAAIDEFRRRKRRSALIYIEDIREHADLTNRDTFKIPIEDRAAVALALQQLSPLYREVVELFFLSGREYLEIAKIMNMPLGTIKSRIFRARQELQSIINVYRSSNSLSSNGAKLLLENLPESFDATYQIELPSISHHELLAAAEDADIDE